MLQQKDNFSFHANVLRRQLQLRNAAYQMSNEQSITGLIAHSAQAIALHFLDLAQVMQDHAGPQQIAV